MKHSIVFIILLFSPLVSIGKEYGSVTVDQVNTIYDGDTFRATINQWPPVIGSSVPIRVAGIDTPELRGKCRAEIELARAAKKHTVARFREAKVVELRNIRRGKYFRLLAEVFVDGLPLADSLLKHGLAVPYSGGSKKDWCANG